jgi:hypothetical protein
MKNIFGRTKLFLKKFSGKVFLVPIISMFGYMTFGNNMQYKNFTQNKLICKSDQSIKKFTFTVPEIIIVYNEHNELQIEMTQIIIKKVEDLILGNFNLRKISYDQLTDYQKKEYSALINSNEPIVFVKNGHCKENISSFAFTKNADLKLKEKIQNLTTYKNCDKILDLRDEFRYLDNPKNKIIVITAINPDVDRLISLYRDKNTKILLISNEELRKQLDLNDNYMYVYYPYKLPFNMKNAELFIKSLPGKGN